MLQEEKCIRNVIKGCAERGMPVSDELASVFYKSCIIDSHMNTNLQKNPTGKTIEKIVELCINRLSVHNDPVILCIKMQLLLERDYKNRDFVIDKVNEDNDKKIRQLLNEILDNDDTIGHDNSIYYQKIIQYIILTNYMGDPTSPMCIQETSIALNNSIILNKLSDFENQLPSSKERQLKKIANLVCGIRLYSYNMDQRACDGEIFNMMDTLPNAVDILLQNVDQELENSLKKVLTITSWICQCYKIEYNLKAPLFVVRTHLATIRSDELDKHKVVLVLYMQYKTNLEIIKRDLNTCKIELFALFDDYNLKLREIRLGYEKINYFDEPELINISIIWSKMIDTMNYLSITTNIILTMKQMTNEEIIKEHIKTSPIVDLFPIVKSGQQKIIETHPLHPMCKWYPPSYHSVVGNDLFADGYCVVMIVETNGTLIKHNKSIIIIQYSDEWFAFTSIQAAIHFGTKPSYYLNSFYNILRSQAHLLFFFHLHEKMTDNRYIANKLLRKRYNSIKYKDAQVQTVLNTYDTTPIKEYVYSSQEEKHCIPQIDNIQKKITRSAQTLDVYKTVKIQTDSCDVGCNTMSEKSTNTIESLTYLSVRSKSKTRMQKSTVEYDDTKKYCIPNIV